MSPFTTRRRANRRSLIWRGEFIAQNIEEGQVDIIQRVKNLMLTPKPEWQTIHGERLSIQEIYLQYLMLIAALPAVGQLLSIWRHGSFNNALRMAITSFVASLIGAYVCALVIDYLAPNFASTRNKNHAFKLVAYAATPSLIVSVLAFVPNIGALAALAGAVYTIYLFYLGLPILMETPQENIVPYMLIAFAVVLITYYLIGWILAFLLGVSFLPL
jgi:ABC-type multidrug transport system permease subunit